MEPTKEQQKTWSSFFYSFLVYGFITCRIIIIITIIIKITLIAIMISRSSERQRRLFPRLSLLKVMMIKLLYCEKDKVSQYWFIWWIGTSHVQSVHSTNQLGPLGIIYTCIMSSLKCLRREYFENLLFNKYYFKLSKFIF